MITHSTQRKWEFFRRGKKKKDRKVVENCLSVSHLIFKQSFSFSFTLTIKGDH